MFRLLERTVTLAPLVGVLLALPAIGSERVFDDHVLELVAQGSHDAVAPGSELDLFRFASGDRSDNLALMAQGSLLPWYSDPDLKITFYRPLSSLLHRLDYLAWPEHAELMYVHSLAWFGLLLVLVWRLYRRLELDPMLAAFAAWLYALNDANGTVVAWLSNRNALVSAVGAVGALSAHVRARREGHAPSRWLAPLWLALGLFAGELGASAWAYLIAYALVLETGSWRERLRSLAPHALVTLGWGACYVASGAGTRASGVYLHPLGDLPAYVAELPHRALVLLGAAFGPFPAELSFVGPVPLMPLWPLAAALVLGVFVWLARRELAHDRLARFWGLGVVLGVAPVAASFPSDRLLVLVDIGAMALVARLTSRLLSGVAAGAPSASGEPNASGEPRPARIGRGARVYGWGLLVVHGLLAPVLLPIRSLQIQQLGRATAHAFACLDGVDKLAHKTLIVLGAPSDFFVGYLQAERAVRQLPRPAHVYWVSNPEAALDLRVMGERTLSTERQGGFFVTPSEHLYRRASAALGVNASVGLPELTARISGLTSEGRPSRVEFRFDEPLGDERFVFIALRGDRYERVAPAELDRLHLEPAPPLSAFLSSPVRN
ncbi:MAG TPA: hypothetical protein VMG12_16650 [Polyangiaceae bacterium]|nr:hypothetical protein [Polyangiaceae bacterium]